MPLLFLLHRAVCSLARRQFLNRTSVLHLQEVLRLLHMVRFVLGLALGRRLDAGRRINLIRFELNIACVHLLFARLRLRGSRVLSVMCGFAKMDENRNG